MTQFATDGVAQEIPAHRQPSPIGAVQRHYRLTPVLFTPAGVCADGVVVIGGARGTYAYPAEADGAIADFTAVAEAPAGTTAAHLLGGLGYRVTEPLAADPAA